MHRVQMIGSGKGNSWAARVLPSWISAIAVAVSVIFSIIVWSTTRSLLKPTERPIISIVEQRVQINKNEKPESGGEIRIQNKLKNIGKNPAEDLIIWDYRFLIKNPEDFENGSISMANRIDSGNDFWFNEHVGKFAKAWEAVRLERTECFIYILLTYKDAYSKKPYHDEFWYKYMTGEEVKLVTVEEKEAFEPKIIPFREKILKGEFKPGQKYQPLK